MSPVIGPCHMTHKEAECSSSALKVQTPGLFIDAGMSFHNHTHDEGSLTPSSGCNMGSDADAERSSSPIARSMPIPFVEEPKVPPLILNSFLPVLQQLGSALVYEDGEYRLDRNIEENDMRHLRAYAARVEELNISIPETPTASNSVYFRLGELRDGNEPLFPSLTRLSITVVDQHDLSHLTLLLSPSLKSLSIANISTKARASLQLFLTMLNPNLLQSIQLTSLELSPSLTLAILQSQNLRCIEFNALRGSLDISDLESVLLLPTLMRCTVDANSISGRMLSTPSSHSYPSLSLEELHITGPPQFLLDLLNFIGDAAILSKIYCKLSSRFHSFDAFLEIIAVHHSQSLRQLILCCPDRRKTDMAVYLPGSPYNKLKGLLLLENLEILGIRFEDVNDALCLLTPNWPHMKRLHLSPMADGRGRLVSLPTLRVVAQSCPLLTDLQCPVEMKSPGASFSSYLLSHGLERLSPAGKNIRYDSQEEEKFPVARYLYALFPRLEAITGYGSTHGWEEVYDLIKMCQTLNQSAREIDALRTSIDGASDSSATRSS